MLLGVDFDNTLVFYDKIFHTVVVEKGLCSKSIIVEKKAIREQLCAEGKEQDWTHVQGYVYGKRIQEAEPFAHAIEVLQWFVDCGWEVVIISHKMAKPYLGPPYDLHKAARGWLKHWVIPHKKAFFEPTKEKKLQRIASEKIDLFIDDLPEILDNALFPKEAIGVCFGQKGGDLWVEDWKQVQNLRIQGGKNNRLYRSKDSVVKQYAPDDELRRVREWVFSCNLWKQGIRCIAEPIKTDDNKNKSVFSDIKGETIDVVTKDFVLQAAHFFQKINRLSPCQEMLKAKEACFSLQEHIDLIESRVQQVENNQDLSQWAKKILRPSWSKLLSQFVLYEGKVTPCISPSDFGFHNALEKKGGELLFFDFEYAGFDDPAKMMCDFFCQVEKPVSLQFWDCFAEVALKDFPDAKLQAESLLPLYRVKWACIVVKDRTFSGVTEELSHRTALAEKMISTIPGSPCHNHR